MKQNRITLDEAFNLLDDCSGVIADHYCLVYPELDHNMEEGIFLVLNLITPRGNEITYYFDNVTNAYVEIDKAKMKLVSTDGDVVTLTLLEIMKLTDE